VSSPEVSGTEERSAAVAGLFRRLGGLGRRGLIKQARAELLLDLLQIVGFRLEVARVRPLERGLKLATDFPVCIAKMIVDGRILGLQLDGPLELLHRLIVVVDAEVGPAERIHDVAVIRPLLDRAADHLHAVVQVHALIDP